MSSATGEPTDRAVETVVKLQTSPPDPHPTSRSVTRWPLLRAQARRTDPGLPPPGTRPCPRQGPRAAVSRMGAVPSGRHVSGGYTNRADRDHDPAGGGGASPGRVGSAPFHRRTNGRVLRESDELDETTSRTTQYPHRETDMCRAHRGVQAIDQQRYPKAAPPASSGGWVSSGPEGRIGCDGPSPTTDDPRQLDEGRRL